MIRFIKHIKESLEDDFSKVEKVLDYYKDDEKPEELKDTSDYILELIRIGVDPETIFQNIDDYILDLTEYGLDEEADELQSATAYWRQKAAVEALKSQRESKKIHSKRIFESIESSDYTDALEELKSVLDYYQGDDSLDDKPGYLIEQSLRILDTIESYINTPFDSVSEADLDGVFDDADNYAENLDEEGFEDEANEVWDAIATLRQR